MKVELDLSNYATNSDLKSTAGGDTLKFAEKVDLASLKSEIDKLDIDKSEIDKLDIDKSEMDKLDIDKLETTPVDLRKLSDVVKMKLLKRLYMMN